MQASAPVISLRNGVVDVHPPLPSLLPAPGGREKYLAYLPHSGFFNQRFSLQNAMTLAYMLNRTLLVPPCRLGLPIPWTATALLQSNVDRQQKLVLSDRCRPHLRESEAGKALTGTLSVCSKYMQYTEVGWEFLFKMQTMQTPVRLVPRTDMRRQWLFSADGLGVDPQKAYRFVDDDRYAWKVYDSKNATASLEQFKSRIDAEDLRSGHWADYDLLEFSSVFGKDRIVRSLPSTQRALKDAQETLLLRMPVLDAIADAIEAQIGGRGTFDAVHLRVGDSSFKESAVEHVQGVLRDFGDHLGVSSDLIDKLLEESKGRARLARRHSVGYTPSSAHWSAFEDAVDQLDGGLNKTAASSGGPAPLRDARHHYRRGAVWTNHHLSTAAKPCRRPLHTAHDRLVLNTRLYIATDAKHPLHDEALAPFIHTFPCAFVLSDFEATVPALTEMTNVRSKQEGVKLGPFLTPLLEAIMAARGHRVFGTPSSTFSLYVKNDLHAMFWPESA